LIQAILARVYRKRIVAMFRLCRSFISAKVQNGGLLSWTIRKNFQRTIRSAKRNGIFGDKKGNIDSTQVAKVIADIFGLRSVQTV